MLSREIDSLLPLSSGRYTPRLCTPGPEESAPVVRAETIEHFNKLVEEGGRPPRDIQLDSACNPNTTDEEIYLFRQALERWRLFRAWQRDWRTTPTTFENLGKKVRQWRQERGFHEKVHLLSEIGQQTKLDEWKEYHAYQISEFKFWSGKTMKAQKQLDAVEQESCAETPRWLEHWQCKDELSSAMRQLEMVTPILSWIEAELPKIALEAGVEVERQVVHDVAKVRDRKQSSKQLQGSPNEDRFSWCTTSFMFDGRS